MYDTVIVGGGAAGCLAAYALGKRNKKFLIIEKRERLARKVLITGKGRCNLTNNTDLQGLMANVCRNGRFLYSAFSAFSPDDIMQLIESQGVPLKTERGNRVFPQSDKAMDIVDALYSIVSSGGGEIKTAEVKRIITEDSKISGVELSDGEVINTKSVIIATGGLSYPQTGSTGDGYRFARALGHTVVDTVPSLTAIETEEDYPRKLQGLSLKNVKVTLTDTVKNKTVYSDQGEMLFTHFGVSGPLILTLSTHLDMPLNRYKIGIDLKPALSFEELDKRVLADFTEFKNRDYINSLSELLPNKLIGQFVKLSGIDGRRKVNSITREERHKIIELLKNMPLTVKSLRPIEEAIITRGGVSVKEISPSTMESKLISGLYFAGEVIDVDAKTGGFNLQIAFSTGYTAGSNAG